MVVVVVVAVAVAVAVAVVVLVVVVVVVVVVSPAAAHDADEAPRCGTHFQHYLNLCWAMLTHLEPQSRKSGRSRKHCKTHNSWGGGGDSLGPWPDCKGFARVPPTPFQEECSMCN